jgi:hypothetical protein
MNEEGVCQRTQRGGGRLLDSPLMTSITPSDNEPSFATTNFPDQAVTRLRSQKDFSGTGNLKVRARCLLKPCPSQTAS